MDELSLNMDTPLNVEQSQHQINQNSNFPEENQVQQQRNKRKHRRGKPRPKNERRAFKNANWNFQAPRYKYNKRIPSGGGGGVSGGGGGGGGNVVSNTVSAANSRQRTRAKLIRSKSLAPYNTNKFLMEEHMVEVPTLLTPTGRTRESSFSVDSEDNYFFSLPEDEEDFLSKEFSNVYEDARVERLESLSKQELIQECLQIEDRYASEGTRQQLNTQRTTAEFTSRIRSLEQKLKELTRENYNLRCQLMRTTAAAASPPSATAPTSPAAAPMVTTSEDTESDSSSSSSSSSSSANSNREEPQSPRRRSFSSSNSNFSENKYDQYNFQAMDAEISSDREQLVGIPMEDDLNVAERNPTNDEHQAREKETANSKSSSPTDQINLQNETNQSN